MSSKCKYVSCVPLHHTLSGRMCLATNTMCAASVLMQCVFDCGRCTRRELLHSTFRNGFFVITSRPGAFVREFAYVWFRTCAPAWHLWNHAHSTRGTNRRRTRQIHSTLLFARWYATIVPFVWICIARAVCVLIYDFHCRLLAFAENTNKTNAAPIFLSHSVWLFFPKSC